MTDFLLQLQYSICCQHVRALDEETIPAVTERPEVRPNFKCLGVSAFFRFGKTIHLAAGYHREHSRKSLIILPYANLCDSANA